MRAKQYAQLTDEEKQIRVRKLRDKRRQRDPPGWVKFGGNQDLFDWFWKQQKGRCGICRKKFPAKRGQGIHFDHCHLTLTARGILCFSCNQKLGWYEKYREEIKEYLGDSA